MKLRPLITPAIVLTTAGGLLAWLLLADPPSVQDKQLAAEGITSAAEETSEPAKTPEPAPQSSPPQAQTQKPSQTQSEPVVVAAAPLPNDIRNVSPEGV